MRRWGEAGQFWSKRRSRLAVRWISQDQGWLWKPDFHDTHLGKDRLPPVRWPLEHVQVAMKTAISYRNVSKLSRPDLDGLVGRLVKRHLQQHLSHFPTELVRLRPTLERTRHRGLSRVRLRLGLPGATLASADESPELDMAIELAIRELERQLERHISHLRHEDSWRRKERRPGLRQLKVTQAGRADAELTRFSELVGPLLPALRRFMQRELAYLQARGDLAPGEPTVDEALARACERLQQRPRRLEPMQWLYQIAIDLLAEEVTRRQTGDGRWISLEDRLPVQLREQPEDGDEIRFEYWQPDEVLRLEDVLPAPDGTPEEAVSAREMRQLATTLLAELPGPWRRAVVLCWLEALPPLAAAQVLGVPVQELERWLMNADAFLKARLGDLRLTPLASGEDADYIVPGALPPASSLDRDFDDVTRGDAPP
ncbi:DNA-directed RNA polymerase specialized sigma subunit, sigma24 family [Burkholderia sp. OK233]|nr:DNA-directed RNA polymerase specialized sigma subunit, sigma24 family [Burkholderia sp. OK233]